MITKLELQLLFSVLPRSAMTMLVAAAERWPPSLLVSSCLSLLAVILALAAIRFVQKRTPRHLKYSLFFLYLYYFCDSDKRCGAICLFFGLPLVWGAIKLYCKMVWFQVVLYSKLVVAFSFGLALHWFTPVDTITSLIHGFATLLFLLWLMREAFSGLRFLARWCWYCVVFTVTAVVVTVMAVFADYCWRTYSAAEALTGAAILFGVLGAAWATKSLTAAAFSLYRSHRSAGSDKAKASKVQQPRRSAGSDKTKVAKTQLRRTAGSGKGKVSKVQPRRTAGSSKDKVSKVQPRRGTGSEKGKVSQIQPRRSPRVRVASKR